MPLGPLNKLALINDVNRFGFIIILWFISGYSFIPSGFGG